MKDLIQFLIESTLKWKSTFRNWEIIWFFLPVQIEIAFQKTFPHWNASLFWAKCKICGNLSAFKRLQVAFTKRFRNERMWCEIWSYALWGVPLLSLPSYVNYPFPLTGRQHQTGNIFELILEEVGNWFLARVCGFSFGTWLD